MPFVYKPLRNDILHVIGSGHLDDQALAALRARLLEDPRFDADQDLLVDLRQVETAEISTAAVRRLAQEGAPRTARRVALVTELDMIFGLARMYQSLRGPELDMEVFRKLADALEWFDEDRKVHATRAS